MSTFQTMIILQQDHGFFIFNKQKGEESKSLERQRQQHMTVSISTKVRKVMLEHRVGVLQELLLRMTTSKDEDA